MFRSVEEIKGSFYLMLGGFKLDNGYSGIHEQVELFWVSGGGSSIGKEMVYK